MQESAIVAVIAGKEVSYNSKKNVVIYRLN